MDKNTQIFLMRQRAAKLIFDVLTERKRVLDAIKAFPDVKDDKSLEASWCALMHYESDEELRKKDPLYAQMQFDSLESIAFCLEKGKDLPVNVISDYLNFYQHAPVSKKHGLFDLWGIFSQNVTIFDKKH